MIQFYIEIVSAIPTTVIETQVCKKFCFAFRKTDMGNGFLKFCLAKQLRKFHFRNVYSDLTKSSLMMNPLTKQVRIGEGLSLSSYFDKYFSIGC